MRTGIELIEHAAAMLESEALELRLSHTPYTDHNDWTGEDQAKRVHDDMIETAQGLQAMVERMKAFGT